MVSGICEEINPKKSTQSECCGGSGGGKRERFCV